MLGPLEITAGGRPLPVQGARVRAVLAMLLVHANHVVAALARPGEILVSRTVSDLVAGSEIAFAFRGRHRLTGISEPWPVFAVTGTPAALTGDGTSR